MTESETEKEIERLQKQIKMMKNRKLVKQKESSELCFFISTEIGLPYVRFFPDMSGILVVKSLSEKIVLKRA